MIITKEQFDEFVESAENQNVLWTDTLALIGVTVGDVPDVDVIEAQERIVAWVNCPTGAPLGKTPMYYADAIERGEHLT